jgi:ATP-binding cassette, subfamily F, member 3
LLDEPTNHLDIKAVEWLESYLTQWEGAAVIVSHDRYFLDHACNALLEMAVSGSEYYRGNYTTYLQEREIRWAHRYELYESEQEKLLKEVDYIKRNISGQNTLQAKGQTQTPHTLAVCHRAHWAGSGVEYELESTGHGSIHSHIHLQRGGSRTARARPAPAAARHTRPAPASAHGESFRRSGHPHQGLESWISRRGWLPEKFLFSAPDIELRRLECAALIGPNGAGKSTFLKTILGSIPPLAGEVILGASLKVGYFAQAHEGLDPDKTVIDEIIAASGMLPYQARDYLGKYLFSGDDVFKLVSMLSGGERGRLALAKLAFEDTNLLLLDEPTNHLDIPSQEILQSVLDNYQGTILLVSHDRYLVDALATQIWEIGGETSEVYQPSEVLRVFNGTYSQMKEEREKEAARLAAEQSPVIQSPAASARKAQNAKSKEERRRLAQLQELENTIAELEATLANLTSQLESPFVRPEEVGKLGLEYERMQREMDEKLNEWERMQA